jgi:hypothetical protein
MNIDTPTRKDEIFSLGNAAAKVTVNVFIRVPVRFGARSCCALAFEAPAIARATSIVAKVSEAGKCGGDFANC